MLRGLTHLLVIAAAGLCAVPARAADTAQPCHLRLVNVEHAIINVPKTDSTGSSLCVDGSPTAVRLVIHQTTIADVFSALLSAYKFSYRSSIALDEARDGTYVGSLGQVISQQLDGYNYVIKQNNSEVDVIIFSKKGERAVTSPIASIQRPPHREAMVSRTR